MQINEHNFDYFNKVRKKLNTLLVKDDLYWRRAKTFWYRDGDLNTRFFHATASARKKVNNIAHLEDADGTMCTSTGGLKSIARNYFGEWVLKAFRLLTT
jgi:hypothetical protein